FGHRGSPLSLPTRRSSDLVARDVLGFEALLLVVRRAVGGGEAVLDEGAHLAAEGGLLRRVVPVHRPSTSRSQVVSVMPRSPCSRSRYLAILSVGVRGSASTNSTYRGTIDRGSRSSQ